MTEQQDQIFFQLQEPTRNDKVAVATTSTVIAEARNNDNKRKVIVVRNIGSNNITCNLGQSQATANVGILLKPSESFVDASGEGYQCFQGVITAIADTASTDIAIMER